MLFWACCFGSGRVQKNGSAKPFATRINARVSRAIVANAEKEKPPDVNPRAFAFLGDRATDLPSEDQSWCVLRSFCWPGLPQPFRSVQASALRRKRDVSKWLAVWMAGFMGDSTVICRVSCRCTAMGAHVTPVFFRLQTIFLQIDERIDRTCVTDGRHWIHLRIQKRATEVAREWCRMPVRPAYRQFGNSTLSMTWITPLLWYTFAIVTLAALPLLSVTVTSLPIVLNVSVSPCTVV
jgi:hypothetical protein